ncbi:MAG TPA: hypothetical protein PKA64_25995 [Myxococcota bacterium]|nr:hypothetical protein [Myxococcota bacterium]
MARPLLVPLLAVALAWPAAVLATGFGGDGPPTRIPVPARVFAATVEDISGASVELSRVSLDGEVFLFGLVGEGQLSIPFENLVEVRVEPTGDAAKRIALARTASGELVRMTVDSDVPCYGDTTAGHFKIELGKVRKVVFKPTP